MSAVNASTPRRPRANTFGSRLASSPARAGQVLGSHVPPGAKSAPRGARAAKNQLLHQVAAQRGSPLSHGIACVAARGENRGDDALPSRASRQQPRAPQRAAATLLGSTLGSSTFARLNHGAGPCGGAAQRAPCFRLNVRRRASACPLARRAAQRIGELTCAPLFSVSLYAPPRHAGAGGGGG